MQQAHSNSLKIFIIFPLLLIFLEQIQNFIKARYYEIRILFSSLIIITILTNISELYLWQKMSNKSIIDHNRKIKRLLIDNEVTKIAGQWSPAFVFDLAKVQSFPIIPDVYNDHIIDELEIKYLFLERHFIDQKI